LNQSTPTRGAFPLADLTTIKYKVLNWLKAFSTFCFLDNQEYRFAHHSEECLVGAGVKRSLKTGGQNTLDDLQLLLDEKPTWLFGHLGYELNNEIEGITSCHPDLIGFPDLFFFEPEIIISIRKNEMVIEGEDPAAIYEEIYKQPEIAPLPTNRSLIEGKFSRETYISTIEKLKQHILRGDCYEINFCQEFFSNSCEIDPIAVYKNLTTVSPNPFSALYRLNDSWLICASPERFLKKEGDKILSQPIKGTAARNQADEKSDNENRDALAKSSKDRSENVMVVDLVRNDLSRICRDGTVQVDELYGIYTFPQVHQMISTVSGELKPDIDFSEIIRATFPMGSMTGAPKKRVMELIAQYELSKRGIFSGTVGYIKPNGNFDLNVVIRSIMYNSNSHYLSFQAGGGITWYSDPEKEWEECLLKAAAIRKVLSNSE
jgi:para-aminobenzoate synthetase component 1